MKGIDFMKNCKIIYTDLFDGKVKYKYFATTCEMQEFYQHNKIEIINWGWVK